MAQAGVQQGILAAKDLELHVPGAADELGSLGDVAAGILHAHDVGHLVGQLVHQRRLQTAGQNQLAAIIL